MVNFKDYDGITERMVIFTDKAPASLVGKKLPMYGSKIGVGWEDKINLETLDVLQWSDKELKKSPLPTLNQLKSEGVVREWTPYKEVYIPAAEKLTNEEIRRICNEQGLDVSDEALNFARENWEDGYKSGFRDEANGVHVFNPIGRGWNRFNLQITELYPGTYWQTTYIA